ncbi:MAG TPA: FAD-binding oxidoreductase [Acidobacteriota bacterium]|nr:FAD-binding oxidoreductase [Acidobacteriota bacterium]
MPDNSPLTPVGLDNTPWDHKWGFADTEFIVHEDRTVELTGKRYNLSGYRMPDFIPYVEEVLGIQLDIHDQKEELKNKPIDPPILNPGFCEAVKAHFHPGQYSFEDRDRLLHSHGQTTTDEVYQVLYGRLERFADMVFYCESEEDAKNIVRLAGEHDVCLVPYGGGTSVSCALKLPPWEKRMIVSVDMRRMNKIEWIDRKNLRACVQAGIVGVALENELSKHGMMCGHEPDSIELSTLGGWIATNASGMKKNRYGNIEQIVENITLVTPAGVIEQIDPLCRASIGMQPQNLLFGNEGNLGLITKAVIKIHPLPEVTKYGSLVFPDIDTGINFLYELAHSGLLPASIRLVDNIQFRFGLALKKRTDSFLQTALDSIKKSYLLKVKGFDPHKMVAATVVMEGSAREVAQQEKHLYRLAKKYNGIPGGADAGQRGYMLTYAIAYIRDFVAKFHVIGETFETSVPWSKIKQVCEAVEKRLREKHEEFKLPGKFYVSYRITQVYHTGVCVYFMYGLYTKGVEEPAKVYSHIEHSLREAILENGGSISHHHGVGKLRKDFMKQTLSPDSIEFLKRAKQCVDPKNVFGVGNNVFAKE